MDKVIQGNCLDVMKTMDDNSVDSIVTDPPYFLISGNGSGGFMNKEWDGVINLWKHIWLNPMFADGVVSFLKSMRVGKGMAGANTAQGNVNTTQDGLSGKKEIVRFAENHLKLSDALKNDSVHLIAVTGQEVLDWLKELLIDPMPIVEKYLNGAGKSALFVIPITSPQKEHKTTVVRNVIRLLKAGGCREKAITFTKQEAVRISGAIGVMNGILSESGYMNGILGSADFAENIAEGVKFSATILYPTKTAELMKNLTLLLYAILVTQELSRTPKHLVVNFLECVFRECYRVIKPGGHVLAFGGSRTYHHLVTAVENAGFECRDQLQWLFGSGFPKSANISKQWTGLSVNKAKALCLLEMMEEVQNLNRTCRSGQIMGMFGIQQRKTPNNGKVGVQH